MRLRAGLVPLATFCAVAAASAQQYQALVLQTPDPMQTLAQGVSSGKAAGFFYTDNGFDLIQQALFWPDRNGPPTVLFPAGAEASTANTVFGNQVAGSWRIAGGNDHAALWPDGASPSLFDLHPVAPDFDASALLGIDGLQQVGYARQTLSGPPFLLYHPALWYGSAASMVDLLPALPGVSHGIATACAGGQQVGYVIFNDPNRPPFTSVRAHAFMWLGTAESATDLHPAAMRASWALGTDGIQEVGYALDDNFVSHAMLWTGSAGSAIDLSPPNSLGSRALACRNGEQVGWVMTETGKHAALWTGDASTVILLDDASASGLTDTVATGIDDNGDIVGYTNDGGVGSVAVMWSPLRADNHKPVAVAGDDETVEATGPMTSVILDGGGSFDPDTGDSLTYHWTDDHGNAVGDGEVVTTPAGLGLHGYTLVVTDSHGLASDPATIHVTVVDTTAPAIRGLLATPDRIEPRDRRWVTVTVSYTLADLVDPNPTATLTVECSTSERDEAVVVDAHHIKIRGSEHEHRKGRHFTVTVHAADHSGNRSARSVQVSMPRDEDCHDHDRGRR